MVDPWPRKHESVPGCHGHGWLPLGVCVPLKTKTSPATRRPGWFTYNTHIRGRHKEKDEENILL